MRLVPGFFIFIENHARQSEIRVARESTMYTGSITALYLRNNLASRALAMSLASRVPWTRTFIQRGAIGVAKISNGPHSTLHADNDGWTGKTRMQLSVNSACSTKSSQNDRGQSGSVVTSVAMKWSFHVLKACSALFIPLVQRIMNSSIHKVTGFSPSIIFFGHSLDLNRPHYWKSYFDNTKYLL